ncbi:MAG: methylmalonyl Co-A mutase-associated GTPase MeaB [Bacteroidales bacterium]|nr:methylmalonyl Co-A mutase-associated GTPase MeaB [Bacteroidales bacterium]
MDNKEQSKSALSVSKGVPQPPTINPRLQKIRKKELTPEDYVSGILQGDIPILSRAITLIESNLPAHFVDAQAIVKACLPHTGKSIRIGITGVPGVGKSSFIESLGKHITDRGRKLAVLAVDPSSNRSRGSILGDKTRMELLAADPNAFIRPSPSAGSLGGVARKTRESILLCEAAGYEVVFVETVGVGQSETAVHSMVDFFLLLMLAGAGDELQGIKRGIMEMADLIAITKADGDNAGPSSQAAAQYKSALHLFPPSASGWTPDVLTCSAHKGLGLNEIWSKILDYNNFATGKGYFSKRRQEQALYWMDETINEVLTNNFYRNESISKRLSELREDVLSNRISSFRAAQDILDEYFRDQKLRK